MKAQSALAIMDDVGGEDEGFPLLTVHYASGRESVLRAPKMGMAHVRPRGHRPYSLETI